MVDHTKMEWRGKAGGRRPGGGGGRDGRLRIAVLVNGRAVVHVIGSASLRTDAEDHRRASSRVGDRGGGGGPGDRRPEVGCGRDGRRSMAVLVNSRDATRLLGSTSMRGEAVGSRGATSQASLFACASTLVRRGEYRAQTGTFARFCFCKNNKRTIIIMVGDALRERL